jgi:hypothetical protein
MNNESSLWNRFLIMGRVFAELKRNLDGNRDPGIKELGNVGEYLRVHRSTVIAKYLQPETTPAPDQKSATKM